MTKITVDNKDRVCNTAETSLITWERDSDSWGGYLKGRVNSVTFFVIANDPHNSVHKYHLEQWFLLPNRLCSNDVESLKQEAEERLKRYMSLAGFSFKAVKHD